MLLSPFKNVLIHSIVRQNAFSHCHEENVVFCDQVFGTSQTPRIAGGAVALTFQLLTPAQRPAQVRGLRV